MNGDHLTLLTDLYQLTMMQGYYKNHKCNQTAVFDIFFRTIPQNGGYAVFAGLKQVISYIEKLSFLPEDISYLETLGMFESDFLEYLSGFHFTGDIYALPEGTVMFPKEPILKVVAPIPEAQLIETAVLNLINHQSLIATKSSRICYAAGNDPVMEFGLRRAHGPAAGIYGARAAIIGGCTATSNLLAGQLFDIPVAGTHAHSWVMSFPDEYTAFKAYARLYPSSCLLLADTYDTLKSGVPNAIRVFKEMQKAGIKLSNYGIRLDSGDLAYLSRQARLMLDAAGFFDATIAASNDLDEYVIQGLKAQDAKITCWGVGTHLITSKNCPSFGAVYKLAAIQNPDKTFTPKIKLAENSEKITNPGDKKLYRIYDRLSGKVKADLICLADECFFEKDALSLFDPAAPWKKTRLAAATYTLREMLVPVFKHGRCVYECPDTMTTREYCQRELDSLLSETRRFINPHRVYVDLSQKLYDITKNLA